MWFSRVFLFKSLIGVTSSKRLPDTPSDVHNELFNHVKEEEEKRAKKILDTLVPRFLHFRHIPCLILTAIMIAFINSWISLFQFNYTHFNKVIISVIFQSANFEVLLFHAQSRAFAEMWIYDITLNSNQVAISLHGCLPALCMWSFIYTCDTLVNSSRVFVPFVTFKFREFNHPIYLLFCLMSR